MDTASFSARLKHLGAEIRELYAFDAVPWVVGYSGGKDSTATLGLIWWAIRQLPASQRTKPIHVITTDTLVEQPMVAAWVRASHAHMRQAAAEQAMPIVPHLLIPELSETFWVNLIGRGYAAPRHSFRWCTQRMKIQPAARFVREMVTRSGEVIMALGQTAASIASAVEQQSQATVDISRNIQQVAMEPQEVSGSISGVHGAVDETNASANAVLFATGELSEQSVILQRTLDDFLAKIRAA